MGISLQEQLLRAGLVDQKKAKQVKKEKHKENVLQRHNKVQAPDESKILAQQALAEKAEQDRLLNLERKAVEDRKAAMAQIKQLIEKHRLPKGAGELTFNFTDDNKVQRVFVSEATRTQIISGKMAIVKLGRHYDVVPADIAEKIRSRNASNVILFNDSQQVSTPAEDDPYADYQVPDDLVW